MAKWKVHNLLQELLPNYIVSARKRSNLPQIRVEEEN
jgi:hypothetical protein